MTGQLADILADGYVLDVDDSFDGPDLDTSRWLPHHLPQWSSRAESAARYRFADGHLQLLIEDDQQPWCTEFDGGTRVSSLQTGVFAGPAGGTVGQHRFSPVAIVREEQRNARLYTPQFGVFELRARGTDDPNSMVALWMIGYEDVPERSAEICICEIFGRTVEPEAAAVGMGVHPFGDPSITDDFEAIRLPIDVREFHRYAAQWTSDEVTFFVDGSPVKTVHQSPQYPMQFMLGIYHFPTTTTDTPAEAPDRYPKRFTVDYFRGYRPR